jgi:hypothetical protein
MRETDSPKNARTDYFARPRGAAAWSTRLTNPPGLQGREMSSPAKAAGYAHMIMF